MQCFIGLASYYRWFVPNFATLVAPLTELTKGKGKGEWLLDWTAEAEVAFQYLKTVLCTCPVLHMLLPHCPFLVYTDASSVGLGAVLMQQTPQGERPIFFS